MTLTIQLQQDEEQAVRDFAKQRGVTVEQFAREAILAQTKPVVREEARRHAEASIEKNAELLRRLA